LIHYPFLCNAGSSSAVNVDERRAFRLIARSSRRYGAGIGLDIRRSADRQDRSAHPQLTREFTDGLLLLDVPPGESRSVQELLCPKGRSESVL